MGESHDVEVKPADRLAEAGIVLVQQAGMALVNDAYQFPVVSSGKIVPSGNDGTLSVKGPYDEYLKTFMKQRDDGKTYFGTWTHTDILDSQKQKNSVKDEVNGGDFTVILVNNRLGSHTDFKDANGDTLFQMDGQTQLTPKDGVIRDSINVLSDNAGNYMGEVHLVAKPVAGNVLDVTAQYRYHDTYLGDVELVMTLDPKTNYTSADIQIAKKWNPPPPPPPVAPATATTPAK